MRDGEGGQEQTRFTALSADEPAVVLPRLGATRFDGRPREASARAVSLARALAFDDSWSRISDARRRRRPH